MVFVLTGNGRNVDEDPWVLPSPEAPSFIGVDKKTGTLKWKDASPGKNIMEGQWASPTLAAPKGGKPQVIFPGGDGWLYSFEPESGKLIWKFNCNPSTAVFNAKNKSKSTKAHFLATPVVWEDRVYIGVGLNPEGANVGHLWCIDLTKTGDVSPVNDIFDAKNPKNKDSALVWHHGGKIDPEPMRGRKYHFGLTLSTCAIHDGLLYVGELDGYLHCYDARTGTRHWVADQQATVWSSPYLVDGKVFLGNEDGDLRVYAHSKEMKQLAKIAIGPGIKTPVKVVDGVLYVLAKTELYAVKVK
jgi:outer membrane protein assembly factor BamB